MRTRADSADLLPYMEHIGTEVMDKVLDADASFYPNEYTEKDVRRALEADRLGPEDFGALLSPAAGPGALAALAASLMPRSPSRRSSSSSLA